MKRFSRARSTGVFSDLFYSSSQKKRLRRSGTGRGVLRYVDSMGMWFWPAQRRKERHELVRAAGGTPRYRGVHRRFW